MLENVPGKLREKLMLEKVRGENDAGKSAWRNCVENCRKSDRQSAVSRTQCYKPQAEKTTVLASVGHRNESCFTYFITHFSKITICSVAFCRIVAICALSRIMAKCSSIRALRHLGEMSRFARFDAYWQNVAIYALCQAQNFGCQALSTILYPWYTPPPHSH